MARKRRRDTAAFEQEAVRLAREEGMTYSAVAEDLGVDTSVIRDGCKKADADALDSTKGNPAQVSVEEQRAKLRREVRILREEREILKKAAAFFAKETR